MDFVGGGSVSDILEACEVTLSEAEARECTAWTVLALDYLHSNRKLHRVSELKRNGALVWTRGCASNEIFYEIPLGRFIFTPFQILSRDLFPAGCEGWEHPPNAGWQGEASGFWRFERGTTPPTCQAICVSNCMGISWLTLLR